MSRALSPNGRVLRHPGDLAGMRTARHGKPPRLGPVELARIRRVLDRGPVQAGFDNDLWTLARVAEVIERTTGVAHHPGHVWRLLKAMRWSLQRPARKAVERDENAIPRWVAQEWPRIRRTVSVWACGPSGSLSEFDAGAAA
jgi:transposase